MKKLIWLLSLTAIFGIYSCQPQVNLDAEKASVKTLFGDFYNSIDSMNIENMASYMAEDILVCGTDPGEFWNKEKIVAEWEKMLEGGPIEMDFLGDRIIKVAPDGSSAYAVDQVKYQGTTIAWRNVYYLEKTEGKWMFSFWSMALVPENKDLGTLYKALLPEPVEE